MKRDEQKSEYFDKPGGDQQVSMQESGINIDDLKANPKQKITQVNGIVNEKKET